MLLLSLESKLDSFFSKVTPIINLLFTFTKKGEVSPT